MALRGLVHPIDESPDEFRPVRGENRRDLDKRIIKYAYLKIIIINNNNDLTNPLISITLNDYLLINPISLFQSEILAYNFRRF